ncbi:hypothetical protein QRD02_09155 [Aequorivita sp. SDUM287046]|uniref:Uncharacterized protein n=1 Tax=Aequorivita aurantiaca TaxID=3053356 RepID=A0ABT8DN20_9FLAO|nr:hypothetical protein [Aequorivita aurantiaca]MDN3724550.1 hypothetical protein [Aequorivita aurantiaca]
MLHLLWAILNIALALYFLYLLLGIIAKGMGFLNTKYKFLSIAIFGIGIIQLLFSTNSEENKGINYLVNDQVPHINYEAKMLTLEENLIFDTRLYVKYYRHQGKYIIYKSNSSLTGFVSGFEWEHTSTELELNRDNNTSYRVNGVLFWKLFNFTIYKQHQQFHGIIEN